MPEATVAEQVAEHLSPYLGPFNAGIAVKTFARKTLQREPDTLTAVDLTPLLEALRPMLHTMVGTAATQALIEDIQRRVR